MLAIFLTPLLTTIFSVFALWPQESHPRASLVERCNSNCASYYRMTESTLTLRILRPPAEMAVLRICSRQSMPLALVNANMRPHVYANFIENTHGIPRNRILFLRSEDCLGSNPEITVTELWSVPQGAALPSHVEAIESCQYQFQFLGRRPRGAREFEGAVNYRQALDQLIRELRANSNAVGVIWGYILEQPSQGLQQRMSEARRIMAQSGLAENRYQVKLEHWYDVEEGPRPQYPSVFIVSVADRCNIPTTPQSNNGMQRTRN